MERSVCITVKVQWSATHFSRVQHITLISLSHSVSLCVCVCVALGAGSVQSPVLVGGSESPAAAEHWPTCEEQVSLTWTEPRYSNSAIARQQRGATGCSFVPSILCTPPWLDDTLPHVILTYFEAHWRKRAVNGTPVVGVFDRVLVACLDLNIKCIDVLENKSHFYWLPYLSSNTQHSGATTSQSVFTALSSASVVLDKFVDLTWLDLN